MEQQHLQLLQHQIRVLSVCIAETGVDAVVPKCDLLSAHRGSALQWHLQMMGDALHMLMAGCRLLCNATFICC